MTKIINLYCDESCHLQNDNHKVMVLGGIICPNDRRKAIFEDIRNIKKEYKLKTTCEVKWTKISPSKIEFYNELLEYFLSNEDLTFRAILVPNKTILIHSKYNQTHDDFYYKMYYEMLKWVFMNNYEYNIYLDLKDTKGTEKIKKLQSFLPSNVKKIQEVKSNEVELIQLADLLIGSIAYYNNNNHNSSAKLNIIKTLISKNCNIGDSSDYKNMKFNLFKINLEDKQL